MTNLAFVFIAAPLVKRKEVKQERNLRARKKKQKRRKERKQSSRKGKQEVK